MLAEVRIHVQEWSLKNNLRGTDYFLSCTMKLSSLPLLCGRGCLMSAAREVGTQWPKVIHF